MTTSAPRSTERRQQNRGNPQGGDRRRRLADRRGENNLLYVSFRIGADHFLIEIHQVQEVHLTQAMTAVPLAPALIAGIHNLRGQIVPAVDLRRLLGGGGDALPEMSVVIRAEDGAFSLLVDEVFDVVETSPTMLVPPPPHLAPTLRDLTSGVYKRPEALLLVLDVAGILRLVDAHGRTC